MIGIVYAIRNRLDGYTPIGFATAPAQMTGAPLRVVPTITVPSCRLWARRR
jgi:hypothetical protein